MVVCSDEVQVRLGVLAARIVMLCMTFFCATLHNIPLFVHNIQERLRRRLHSHFYQWESSQTEIEIEKGDFL